MGLPSFESLRNLPKVTQVIMGAGFKAILTESQDSTGVGKEYCLWPASITAEMSTCLLHFLISKLCLFSFYKRAAPTTPIYKHVFHNILAFSVESVVREQELTVLWGTEKGSNPQKEK